MKYWTSQRVLEEANYRGLRRALFVTALEIELQAVRGHIQHLASCAGRDKTIYECGVFSEPGQGWLIVAAEAGGGTHPTQNVVTNAHVDFGPFEAVLFVGVAGTRKPDDAPLGSVVASERVYYPYPGKYGEHGRSARPHTFPVSPMLLQLAKKVRRDGTWIARITAPLNGNLPPPANYPFTGPPVGHVAPIISTEAVSANPESELEALIAREFGDACVVEMEGYGAAYAAYQEATPAMIVRGVSDLAKNKTPDEDKIRQPVAACHAAAFAFEILAEMNMAYPSDAPPPPPTAAPSQKGADGETVPGPAQSTEPRARRTVLNIDGDRDDISPERLRAIEALLRKAAGDPSLKIDRTDEGSVRLIVDDPTGALGNLDLDELKSVLQSDESMLLLGRVAEDEVGELERLQSEVSRASTDLLSWPSTLTSGERIERPELDQLLSMFKENTSSATAILGQPGSGKSSLLATLGNALVKQGHPVLAIKADLLDSEVRDENDIARQLGLSDAPSRILGRLARLRPTYLLVDQLDALAGYLDVRTGRLSALLNLVRRLGNLDNIHIVLSARTFEYEHDVRLRSISAENVQLQLPGWSQVLPILEARQIKAAGWPEDAKEVMRIPQALATYLQLQAAGLSEPLVTYQVMLDRLWTERVLVGENGARRSRLASDMADQMAEEESLWLARAKFDEHHNDIEVLIGAGILTPYAAGVSIGFTHQTVFDYALSRSFAQRKGRLSSYVLERQASLFVRPKLWAALAYLREAQPSAYAADIEAMWNAQGLRRHLQLLLVDFLGQQVSPSDHEALLMERALRSATNRAAAFKAIAGSPGWFHRLKDSFIGSAMTEDETTAGWMVNLLTAAWRFAPDEVTRLLKSKWSADSQQDYRTWMVINEAPMWSDDVSAMGVDIVSRTEIAPIFLDQMVAQVGVEQPDKALELLRARLDRELVEASKQANERAATEKPTFAKVSDEVAWWMRNNPSEPLTRLVESRNEWDSVPSLAEKAPRQFLEAIWPWFLNYLAALEGHARELPGRPRYALSGYVDFRFEDETRLELPEPAIIEALRTAAEKVAAQDSHYFREWVAENVEVDATPVQRLIAHAMASVPTEYAEDSFTYLMGDARRLWLGGQEKLAGTTARLVRAVSDHWSEEQLEQFEAFVRAFVPSPPSDLIDPKGKRDWVRLFRQIRWFLLRALPAHRLSPATRRTIEEEARALPQDEWQVRFSGVQMIGSIMEADAMARASDEDILNAFRELADATGWDHPRHWERGGNIQLSRAFATFAKENPVRARAIMAEFTKGFGERASGYALESMSEDGDPNEIASLFLDLNARGFDSREFRNSASFAMQRVLDETLPLAEEVAAVLEGWIVPQEAATELPPGDQQDSEGEDDEPSDGKASDGQDESTTTRSLLWGYGGFVTVPQADNAVAVEALIHLRLRQKNAARVIETLTAYMAHSQDEEVWRHLLSHLIYLQPSEGEDAADRVGLLRSIFAKFPKLAGSREAAYLLAHVHWWAGDFVAEELARWRDSEQVAAKQGYGELVALIALVRPELEWARTSLTELESAEAMAAARAGAALSAANLWNDETHRATSTALITRLLANGEAGVWAAVFDVFRIVDDLRPDENTSALLEVIANRIETAPSLDVMFVVERLQALLPHDSALVAKIAEGIVAKYRDEIGDIRTSNAASAGELVNIAITLHRLGPATREAGTRLFEALIEINAYSARQTMDEIDNRFREDQGPRRPRLPRRNRRARRANRTTRVSR